MHPATSRRHGRAPSCSPRPRWPGSTRCTASAGAQAVAAMAYGTEIDPARRRHRRTRQRLRVASPSARSPASWACPRASPVRARWSWSPTGPTPAEYAAIDLMVQVEHGPDSVAWLIAWDEAVADRIVEVVAKLLEAAPRRAVIGANLETNAYTALVDGPEQAIAVANRIAPEHLELMTADPEALRPAGPPRWGGVLRPVRAGQRRRLPRRPQPRAADLRLGPVRRARCASTTSSSTSTSCPWTETALAGVAPLVATLAEAEGLRHARRERAPPRRAPGWGVSRVPAIRADLGLGEGYHSPQVEAAVRLNTNESPLPPPDAWVRAVQDELALVAVEPLSRPRRLGAAQGAWPRSTASAPEQVLCANGSNEVLQTLLLAYGGPGRSVARVGADLRPAPPHRPSSPAPRSWPAGGPRICASTSTSCATSIADAAADGHVPVLPQQPHRRGARPDGGRRRSPTWAPGLVVVDEAYGQFAPWSAAGLVGEDMRLVVTRTFSKTWSLAGLRLGYCLAPTAVVAAMERAVAAVPPRRLQPDRRPARPRARRRDGAAGCADRGGARPRHRRARRPRRRRVAVRRQLRAVPPAASLRGATSGRVCSTGRCSCATAAAGSISATACGSRSGQPPRTTRSSPPCRRSCMTTDRGLRDPRRPKETVDRRRPWTSTAEERSTWRPGSRSSTTWSRSSASTAGSTCRVSRRG